MTVTRDHHQVYYQGLQIKLPATDGAREYYRTITEKEFPLADPRTGEAVFSFPLPLHALRVNGRDIASCAIRGVYLSHPPRTGDVNVSSAKEPAHFENSKPLKRSNQTKHAPLARRGSCVRSREI